MKAVITGASSGIGLDMAKILCEMGAEVWLVARREGLLEKIKSEIGDKAHILPLDLSNKENCIKLYETVKDKEIDIFINNAGFGLYGDFPETDLDRELQMIDLNISALHILTKLFLKDFKKRNRGYILNVASSAAFLPGPKMSAYYATKAYVVRLTTAIFEELRRKGCDVYVGALCPGPVDTGFNDVAGVRFSLKSLKSKAVAQYAIKKMFKRKLIIIPGFMVRLGVLAQRFVPLKLLLKISYNIQNAKSCEKN